MSSKLFERMPPDVKRLNRIARREQRQAQRRDFWQRRQRGPSETSATSGAKVDP